MHKLMNANKLNPCKLLSVAIIYSLVEGSFSNDLQRALTIHVASGEPSIAFSFFCKRSHRISFQFFSLPDMGIISFLGFARKKDWKCLSPGANLKEVACLSSQGAAGPRLPQAHKLTRTQTEGESVCVIEHHWCNNPLSRVFCYP